MLWCCSPGEIPAGEQIAEVDGNTCDARYVGEAEEETPTPLKPNFAIPPIIATGIEAKVEAPPPLKPEAVKAAGTGAAKTSDFVPQDEGSSGGKDEEPAFQKFEFAWSRDSVDATWGVDLGSDSPQSLTILGVHEASALAALNARARTPLRPGDVILRLGDAKLCDAMLETLRTQTSFTTEAPTLHFVLTWLYVVCLVQEPGSLNALLLLSMTVAKWIRLCSRWH